MLAEETEEDPPEYNVAARLRQLNEKLAQEDEPDDERERSIKFKDNLVDLVAPPPDYLTDEEGEEGDTDRTEESKDTDPPGSSNNDGDDYDEDLQDSLDSPKQNDNYGDKNNNDNKSLNRNTPSRAMAGNKRPSGATRSSGDSSAAAANKQNNIKNGDDNSSDEKILVERDGKFELINVKDLTAAERQMYLPEIAEKEEDGASSGISSGSYEPEPPKDPRPSTAGTASSRRKVTGVHPRRAQSAQAKRVQNQPILEDFNYNSPYALTDKQKKAGREQKKAMEDRERKGKQVAKLKEEEKNRKNNEAFEAWLAQKRRDLANRRREDNEKQKEQKRTEKEKKKERDESGAFDAWLKHKKEQKRREKDEEQKRRECDEGWYIRPKEESRKAYKQWLKKKSLDSKNARILERQRVRIHKLMVRRSHKALQLARAIRQSQSFKYVDYYGYRY